MSGGGQAPTPYQPPNQAGAASTFQSGTNALSAGGTALQSLATPGYQSLYSGAQQNPYYAGAQASADQAAQGGQQVGQQAMTNAGTLSDLGTSLGQYAPAIAQTAFDPQSAVYNQLQQQNTDQTAAINSMSGVGGSPYGAGLMGQSNQNLNLKWQQDAAARQNQGIAALQGLASAQQGLYTGAQGLGAAGLGTQMLTGQAPTQTYQQQQQYVQQALDDMVSGTTNAYGLTQQATTDAGNYLTLGQQASAGSLNAWKAQQASDQAFWSSITGLAGDAMGMVNPIKIPGLS